MAFYKTADNNFGTARLIVDSTPGQGTHTTIAAALTDASSGQTIFVRPGTFNENLTLKAGVNLAAYECDGYTPNVIILGKATATFDGTCSISGIRLKTNTAAFLEVSGSSATVVNILNCYLDIADATAISFSSSSSSSAINVINSSGSISSSGIAAFSKTSSGSLNFRYSNIGNSGSSTTSSTCTAGTISFNYCQTSFAITTSSTGFFTANFSGFNTQGLGVSPLTLGGTASNNNANVCQFVGGTSPGIVVDSNLLSRSCTVFSSNASAVSGAGTLHIGSILFSSTSSTISCTVVNDLITTFGKISIGDNVEILSGSGSPNGVVSAPKGSLFLRTDGTTTNNRAYINTDGGTTWTALTTIA